MAGICLQDEGLGVVSVTNTGAVVIVPFRDSKASWCLGPQSLDTSAAFFLEFLVPSLTRSWSGPAILANPLMNRR